MAAGAGRPSPCSGAKVDTRRTKPGMAAGRTRQGMRDVPDDVRASFQTRRWRNASRLPHRVAHASRGTRRCRRATSPLPSWGGRLATRLRVRLAMPSNALPAMHPSDIARHTLVAKPRGVESWKPNWRLRRVSFTGSYVLRVGSRIALYDSFATSSRGIANDCRARRPHGPSQWVNVRYRRRTRAVE